MSCLPTLVVIFLVTPVITKEYISCERNFTKIGCYQTYHRPDASTMELLINDRDSSSGYDIEWNHFGESIHSLACRCSEKAKSLGYTYFSIRFYGECYGGRYFEDFQKTIPQGWDSSECMNHLFSVCDDSSVGECVGKGNAAYVYKVGKEKNEVDLDGGLSQWNDWSGCSSTCGTGVKARERSCTNPVPKGDGKPCEGELTESKPCIVKECPIDGGFTEWCDFSACTKSCGGGIKKRYRTCTDPEPAHGGMECIGPVMESVSCKTSKCPIDGGFSEWSKYSTCTVTCGGGTQTKTRSCTNPTPQHGGKLCEGKLKETQKCNTAICPVDGKYGVWSVWEKCTKSCGGGVSTRVRSCDSPSPAHGGVYCAGDSSESKQCNTDHCPIDGGFTRWSEYSKCSASCGGGTQTKTRSCTNPIPQYGGKDCEGEVKQTQKCNTMHCPVDGNYGPWSTWQKCSTSCGTGLTSRSRKCDSPAPAHSGAPCSDISSETNTCNANPCPVDGKFGSWSSWEKCNKSCGTGVTSRVRECDSPAPTHGGKKCLGTALATKSCNSQPCPVDGGFTRWGKYSKCSASCGGGTQTRTRSCTNPIPQHGGKNCEGEVKQTQKCNTMPCPVDGKYGPWSTWQKCSTSCGTGATSRSRKCDSPAPAHGGAPCSDISSESETCNTNPCPVDGEYGSWSSWVKCSKSCGTGLTSRSRKCDKPAPAHGGASCSDISSETMACNTNPCPVDGGFTTWSDYSTCSTSCGEGTETRTRSCTNPTPQHGGKVCNGESKQTKSCNPQKCPIDGQYGPWSFWEYCSKSCGSGYTSQSRTCDNPLPAHGGKTCVGESKRTKLCKTDPCPVDGGYSPWSKYNSCSKTCASGSQSRSRTCDDPKPQHGGKDCSSLGDATETRRCNANKCPVNGKYGKWADWESCSKSCGEGSTARYRKCNSPTPAHGGDPCSGVPFETKSCSIQVCPVDGGYSPWSEYNSCSKTCGSGSQSRSRTCDDPKPQHGGKDCSSLGDATETRSCSTDSCTGSTSKEMTKYVCENKYLNINCGLGGRIVITYASFGRLSTRYCGWSPYFSKSCHAGSSHIQTVARCNNKQYCSVQASVKIFGDPCRGTDKYLEVKYKCRDGPYVNTR